MDKENKVQAQGIVKIRWREFEMVIFSVICALVITGALIRMYRPLTESLKSIVDIYKASSYEFNYYRNVFFPQVIPIVVLVLCYFWINLVMLPQARRISNEKSPGNIVARILLILFQLVSLSYILAITANVASYYSHPHLFNYGGFQFLAFFGYNDAPLADIFFGYGRALAFTGVYVVYVTIRELIIYFLELPGNRSSYRVFVANRICAFTGLYLIVFLCLTYFNLIHENNAFFKIYFALVGPILFVFYGNIYWLFPEKDALPFTDTRVAGRLIFFTFVCSLPFFMFIKDQQHPLIFILFWAFLLFVVTPVSWIFYRQRKDKILELRGMEKALSKSTADLQFLRSQINPHFLFNTLNTLYGTALQEGSGKTAEGIQKLGDMMRFMMQENNQDLIPMQKEIEYLENYISLQKLRIQSSSQIAIETDIAETPCNFIITPMLLIPFVENAFKHGISLKEKSWIWISLHCDEKGIHFKVRNSTHSQVDNNPERDKSGIGLRNVTERLKILYPRKHQLSVNNSGNEFSVELLIQP